MSLYSLSSKLASYIAEETEMDQHQIDNVRYGLEIILGALIKGATLLTLAYFLGILPHVIIAITCGSLLRLVSGGAHCTSYLRCLSCGLVIYLSIGKIAFHLENNLNPHQLVIILPPCFLVMTLCAFLWAPAEVPYRKIKHNESIFFKILTIVFLIVWLNFAFYYANQIKVSYSMAGLLALLAQTFSYTPIGYLVFGKIDTHLSNITTRKGGELKNGEN